MQEGVSASHVAVRNGHMAVVKFLIEECNCRVDEKTFVCVPIHVLHVCLHFLCMCVKGKFMHYRHMCVLVCCVCERECMHVWCVHVCE